MCSNGRSNCISNKKQEALREHRPPSRLIWWMWNSLARRETVHPKIFQNAPYSMPDLSWKHYNYVIMCAMASQITSLTIVYSTVYSGADQRKHQSSASLAFVRGIHRRPVNSPQKWPVTRKMFPFDDVIMTLWESFGAFSRNIANMQTNLTNRQTHKPTEMKT